MARSLGWWVVAGGGRMPHVRLGARTPLGLGAVGLLNELWQEQLVRQLTWDVDSGKENIKSEKYV